MILFCFSRSADATTSEGKNNLLAKPFKMAMSANDDFNGPATFRLYRAGSGASTVSLSPSYFKNTSFADNLTVDGNAVISHPLKSHFRTG